MHEEQTKIIFKTGLDAMYERHTQSCGSAFLSQRFPTGADALDADRDAWLGVYRSCLTDLAASFGPPGKLFLDKAEIVQDAGSNRQVAEEAISPIIETGGSVTVGGRKRGCN